MKLIISIVFGVAVTIGMPSAATTQSNADTWCHNGFFRLLDETASGPISDLALDISNYDEKDIFIVSHMYKSFQSKELELKAVVGDLEGCYPKLGWAHVDTDLFVELYLYQGNFEPSRWRHVRKLMAKTKVAFSHNRYAILGKVKTDLATRKQYIHVVDIEVYEKLLN